MADAKVADLIRKSHSEAAAEAYLAFVPSDDQVQQLAEVGKEILTHFPRLPGGCAVMSALYGAILQDKISDAVIHVVAGTLHVEGERVFGQAADHTDWNEVFGNSDPSWDGHCWVVYGDFIADISIFRTAYSPKSPPALARYIRSEFGEGRGLLVSKRQQGLRFESQYVLTEPQITALARGALHLMRNQSGPNSQARSA